MIAAAVNWELRDVKTGDEFLGHLHEVVSECKSAGAELVVLPECISLELLHLYPDLEPSGIAAQLAQNDYAEFASTLAQEMRIWLVAGTTFSVRDGVGYNEAIIATPDGTIIRQTKNVLTQFEEHEWGIAPGAGLNVISDFNLGVTICYDAEFPESGRALADAGVLIQCVPAFTETARGFQRVRWCCQARATENQNFVIHASLVGSLGREPVPLAVGSSAILCPSVEPFVESAVLAETEMNKPGIAIAELDFEKLEDARQSNDVRNFRDRKKGDWTIRSWAVRLQ